MLRDGQPDIFQGDKWARARHMALSEAGFLDTHIAIERTVISTTDDPVRKKEAEAWVNQVIPLRNAARKRAGQVATRGGQDF